MDEPLDRRVEKEQVDTSPTSPVNSDPVYMYRCNFCGYKTRESSPDLRDKIDCAICHSPYSEPSRIKS